MRAREREEQDERKRVRGTERQCHGSGVLTFAKIHYSAVLNHGMKPQSAVLGKEKRYCSCGELGVRNN